MELHLNRQSDSIEGFEFEVASFSGNQQAVSLVQTLMTATKTNRSIRTVNGMVNNMAIAIENGH